MLDVALSLGFDRALLLLASRDGLDRRLSPVRRAPLLDRSRGPRAERDRHGLHDRGPGRHAHRHRRRRGDQVPRPDDRAHDDEPPARLPGLRRGRRVPPAGHDGDDRAQLPALPGQQAHLPQPGPRAVRRPRDEPLHHLLPVHAVLQRLRRRPRLRRLRPAQPGVLRPRGRRRRSRASSAATWSRSAPPGSSPTRRSGSTTRASGTCRRPRRCARTAASAARRRPERGTASCAAS